MMRRPTFASAAIFIALAASVAGAQKTLVTTTGSVFRYHGDTIWMERDTTETRIIYHGDTIVRRMTIDGRRLNEVTMVLAGDSAKVVSSVDTAGKVTASQAGARSMPRLVATMERDMLARELEMQPIRERVEAFRADLTNVPLSPSSPITYALSPATTIIHVRDTVRYVRGCPSPGRADTTVFLLFGQDSTRRLTAPARTFGQAMAVSLISQMRMSIVRQQLAARASGASRELPQIPEACPGKKP